MDKGNSMIVVFPIFVVAVLCISFFVLLPARIEEERNKCRINCGEKGFNYTKYSSGGFGGDECWCFDVPNNRSMRIW